MRTCRLTTAALAVLAAACAAATVAAAEPQALPTPAFRGAFDKVAPGVVRVIGRNGYSTGLIVSPDGLVVTHNSAAARKNQVIVLFANGREFDAKVLVRDDQTRLAILQLLAERPDDADQPKAKAGEKPAAAKPAGEGQSKPSAEKPSAEKPSAEKPAAEKPAAAQPKVPTVFTPVPLGSSAALKVGSWVAAISYPYGADTKVSTEPSLSADILSARGKIGGKSLADNEILVTGASMNIGSEGGALVNLEGQVVGILLGPERHAETRTAIHMALPVEVLAPLIKRAREHPDAPLSDATDAQARTYGYLGIVRDPDVDLPLIDEVVAGSPAQKAGLQAGDLVVKAGEEHIATATQLQTFLKNTRPGDKIRLTVKRVIGDGVATKEIEVELGKYPKE